MENPKIKFLIELTKDDINCYSIREYYGIFNCSDCPLTSDHYCWLDGRKKRAIDYLKKRKLKLWKDL